MVETKEIAIPDIIPFSTQTYMVEFYDAEKKPIANTEFRYSADNAKTLSGTTDANGLLQARVKNYPPQNISLSLPA